MTGNTQLQNLRALTKSQKEKAQGEINKLRRNIASIEQDIKYSEGEKDQADFLLMHIDAAIEAEERRKKETEK